MQQLEDLVAAQGQRLEEITSILSNNTDNREILQLVDQTKQHESQLSLRADARQELLRAARQGSGMDELQVRLTAALQAQADADMANIQGPVHALTMSGGLNLLVQSAMLLGVADLKGALAACRQFRNMLPKAVHTLNGFDPEKITDESVIAMVQRFTQVKVIDLGKCSKLTDAAITAVALP